MFAGNLFPHLAEKWNPAHHQLARQDARPADRSRRNQPARGCTCDTR